MAFRPRTISGKARHRAVPEGRPGPDGRSNGVQLMKPMDDLDQLLERAVAKSVFRHQDALGHQRCQPVAGSRRSSPSNSKVGKQILGHGLMPIIEPEVNIKIADKADAEALLLAAIQPASRHSRRWSADHAETVAADCDKPLQAAGGRSTVMRVVALSGGYSRDEANSLLSANGGVIASFSRALTEGLSHGQSDADFDVNACCDNRQHLRSLPRSLTCRCAWTESPSPKRGNAAGRCLGVICLPARKQCQLETGDSLKQLMNSVAARLSAGCQLPIALIKGLESEKRRIVCRRRAGRPKGQIGDGPALIRVLVIGDSSAAGVGAEKIEDTLGPQIAAHLHQATGKPVMWRNAGANSAIAAQVRDYVVPHIEERDFHSRGADRRHQRRQEFSQPGAVQEGLWRVACTPPHSLARSADLLVSRHRHEQGSGAAAVAGVHSRVQGPDHKCHGRPALPGTVRHRPCPLPIENCQTGFAVDGFHANKLGYQHWANHISGSCWTKNQRHHHCKDQNKCDFPDITAPLEARKPERFDQVQAPWPPEPESEELLSPSIAPVLQTSHTLVMIWVNDPDSVRRPTHRKPLLIPA
jgi:hypothetical protein